MSMTGVKSPASMSCADEGRRVDPRGCEGGGDAGRKVRLIQLAGGEVDAHRRPAALPSFCQPAT